MISGAEPGRKRRLTITIYPTKLEGGALCSGAIVRVDTRLGFRNKQSLLSPKTKHRRASNPRVVSENGGVVVWTTDDGVLERGCSDQSEFDLSFAVLRNVDDLRQKWEEIGRASDVKVEKLGKRKEMETTSKLPIRLQGCGGCVLISTLTVVVDIAVEERSEEVGGDDSAEIRKTGFLKRWSFSNKNKVVGMSSDSGELRRSNSVSIVETRPSTKSLRMLKKIASFFTGNRRRVEPVLKKMDVRHENGKMSCEEYESSENTVWEAKEVVSRDGEVELKCSLILASFDQCSSEVAGEGACSVIVALIAHWLHMNKGRMPTRAELDRLMVEGAVEWKKLQMNEASYLGRFPDSHFDIETVVKAGIRPLKINEDSSVVGFFSPHKFALLEGVVCVDGIWSDIVRNAGVYIVSWNDHFCVLTVEANACYLIDSLGSRLKEGCNKAFILRFDESSAIVRRGHMRPEGEAASKPEEASCVPDQSEKAEAGDSTALEEKKVGLKDENIICRGRECCKEFFKRFLAAILVKQLEEKQEKGIVDSSELCRMLQIEFQYTTSTDLK